MTFDFSVFFKSKSLNKQIITTRGDSKSKTGGDRCQNTQYGQADISPFSTHSSLNPLQTLNYTKLNKARRDLEWEKEMKNLQIKQL